MGLISFLKLVEIKTTIASIIPFALGTLFTIYRFHKFNFENFILMLVSLLAIDLATTGLNNYMDFKRAKKTNGYKYEMHNAMVKYSLKKTTAAAVIVILILIGSICGFILFLNTNIVVLLLGIMSFMVSILYSYGPIPISATPLGEIFSGTFQGFMLLFTSVYIHVYDKNIVSLAFYNGMFNARVNIIEIIYIFIISLPSTIGIINIMLANNICDVADDIENKRYTLPIYIGIDNALKLYKILYYAAFISIIILISLKLTPIVSAVALITFFKVDRNIKVFCQKHTKKDTFGTSIENFVLMNSFQIIAIGSAVLINRIF